MLALTKCERAGFSFAQTPAPVRYQTNNQTQFAALACQLKLLASLPHKADNTLGIQVALVLG
jgi:hypothetical protein